MTKLNIEVEFGLNSTLRGLLRHNTLIVTSKRAIHRRHVRGGGSRNHEVFAYSGTNQYLANVLNII